MNDWDEKDSIRRPVLFEGLPHRTGRIVCTLLKMMMMRDVEVNVVWSRVVTEGDWLHVRKEWKYQNGHDCNRMVSATTLTIFILSLIVSSYYCYRWWWRWYMELMMIKIQCVLRERRGERKSPEKDEEGGGKRVRSHEGHRHGFRNAWSEGQTNNGCWYVP